MKRILFVDDESRILDGFRRMLHANRDRWEMQFVTDGEAALTACETGSFDVVISDMMMPGMDGATLLGLIRDRFPNTARIVLSGYAETGLTTRAISVAHRFLSKPCSTEDLQSTIERVCALQDLVGSPEIRRIVGSVGELPSLSSTYTDLTEALKDPNTSICHVAGIVQRDAAMTAKVLQLTNSAFFGLAQRVTSLSAAVSYLGMETIKNLALASEAFRLFVPDSRIHPSICDSIQQHALSTAAIAGLLPVERRARDLTIVAALLHDIGRLFLASAMPDAFCAALSLGAKRECWPFEAEEELIGTSHAEIGAYLLGLWGIPNLAVEAIAHHHRPTRIPHSGFDISVAVYVADLLAHEMNASSIGLKNIELSESDRAHLEELGVSSQWNEFRELALQTTECAHGPAASLAR